MVGWWNTLIGDLYEQVTIWEYDNMEAFEKAVASLGASESFGKFVKLRDPLLAGEKSRFLKLADGAESPRLPELAATVIHETHHVPADRMGDYLHFMQTEGLSLLNRHGFGPVGPFVVEVGKSSEVTMLFPFESLVQRDRLKTAFEAHPEFRAYNSKLFRLVDDVTTRLLLPASFARPAESVSREGVKSSLLPHLTEVCPGIYATGFANRHQSANCGWVALADQTVLIDLPRGIDSASFLDEVKRIAGKPPQTLVLTHLTDDDTNVVRQLLDCGIEEIVTTSPIAKVLTASKTISNSRLRSISETVSIGSQRVPLNVIPH